MPKDSPRLYRPARTALFVSIIFACTAMHAGCVAPGGGADLAISSSARGGSSGTLTPQFTTAAYFPTDQNTADIYLSDIPASDLANPGADLTGASGNIVHIHVFLIPSAGMTPIENTACNITVRHLILAGRSAPTPGGSDAKPGTAQIPAIGLYGGGGFMITGSDPGDDDFSGTIRDASVRLTRSSPAFTDRLGPATMAGKFSAPRDDKLARLIAARFEQISRVLVIQSTTPAP